MTHLKTTLLTQCCFQPCFWKGRSQPFSPSKGVIIIANPTGNLIHRTEWCFSKVLTSALEFP